MKLTEDPLRDQTIQKTQMYAGRARGAAYVHYYTVYSNNS